MPTGQTVDSAVPEVPAVVAVLGVPATAAITHAPFVADHAEPVGHWGVVSGLVIPVAVVELVVEISMAPEGSLAGPSATAEPVGE